MASPSKHKRVKVVMVKDGHLPVTEFLSDRAGANSPFGDDQTFPLPAGSLVYRHPTAKD
jgi:hypothetical protein